MGASQNFNISLNINANAQSAEKQLQNLQKQLQQISNMKVDVGVGNLTADIEQASQAAMKLSAHLATATNPQTGNLDFTKFYSSIQKSGASLQEYGAALQKMGPAGQKAFVSLADSISKSEIPLKRTSKMVDKMWDGLKRTAGWQVQSSIIHGIVGGVQQAVGYAKDLNKSLTDIRIVTGQSTDQMAKFAKEANKAAKNLSTTTTDYTRASLIYYQQGLSDAEVKARTETTIKMANATGTSAQKVSDQMTAIWNNYDNGTKSLTHYADVMTALGAATASSTDEIAQGLQKFASISNTVGLSYEYAASALATITAESRESADVVGNALKTLFSRIQGLQLGETLDDGTTLNKYSTALAKVGISIKDQAGGLKDMDDILDEMGSKWQTLERDEKMALAQTVAGVRQYTQLMTLMENWDDFKSNLNIANTSTGTLNAQANIYAESWAAASDRVRASWEGLWDNLINSDSAIEVLDFISSLAEGLDNIVSGLGGAKGLLTAFGGVLAKVFAPQLANTIADTAYNIKMMLPGADKRAEKQRQGMLTDLQGALQSGHMDIGTTESRVRNATIEARLRESQMRAERERTLTDEEKIMDSVYASQLEFNREAQIKNAQEIDAAMNARADLAIDEIGTENLDMEYSRGGKQYREMIENEELFTNPNLDVKKGRPTAEAVMALEQAYYNKDNVAGRRTGKTRRQILNEAVSQNQDFMDSITDIGTAKQKMYDFAKATGYSAKSIDKWFDGLSEFATEEEKLAHIREKANEMAKANRDSIIEDMDANAEERGLSSEELSQNRAKYREYFDKAAEIEAKKRRGEQLSQQEQDFINNRNKMGSKKVNWSDALVGASQGLMSTVAALESLKSFANDPSLLSLAGVVSNGAMAFNGFTTLFKSLPGEIGKASGILSLLTIAFITAFDLIDNALDKWDNRFNNAAQNAATSAQELQTAYETNKKNHQGLLTTIEEYQKSETKLKDLTLSSKERADAEYEHNRLVGDMISKYNLQEGEYSRIGNQLDISQAGLDRITEQSESMVNASRAAADQAAVNAKERANIAEAERLRKSMKESSGKDADVGNVLLAVGGAAALTAAIAFAAPAVIAAIPALALSGAGFAAASTATAVAPWLLGAAGASTYFGAVAEGQYAKKDFVDEALNITEKKKGDTSWLNDIESIMAEGFTEKQAKIIYQYRDSLEQLSASMKSAELAGDAVAENAARNAVASDKAASASEHQSKIVDGATQVYQKNYDAEKEKIQKQFDGWFDNTKKKQEMAEGVMNELGLSNLQGFSWGDDDKSNKRLNYSYIDESGKVQTGAVSYDSIIEAQASKSANAAVNGYIDQSLLQLKALEQATGNKKTAGGLFSLLTGGDFETATREEINAAKTYLSKIDSTGLLEQFGLDEAAFKEKYKMSSKEFLDYYKNYTPMSDQLLSSNDVYNTWAAKEGNAKIVGSMSENAARQLYSNLTKVSGIGGAQAGEQFLNGLTMMLEDSDLSTSDYGKAMESLMAIDWTSATAVEDAASVLNNLGGHVDMASAAWQSFAASMQAATNAMPDFSQVISQLTQLLGVLSSAEIGDVLDASFVEEMMSKYPGFEEMVMKTWDGNYKLTGDPEKYLELMQQDASKKFEEMSTYEDLADKYFGEDGALKGQESDITFDNIVDTISAANATGQSAETPILDFVKEAGYTEEQLTNAKEQLTTSENNLNSWNSTGSGRNIDGIGNVKYDAQNDQFIGPNGKVLEGTDALKAREQYNKDVLTYQTNKSTADTIESNLQNIATADYDLMTEEGKEQFASTFNSADKVMKAVTAGNKMLVDDNGIISDAAMDQLRVLPDTSARVTAAFNDMEAARNALLENENDPVAQQAYAEAEANYALQTSIDAVAAARGLDADAVAYYAQSMQDAVLAGDISAEQAARVAGDLAAQAEGLDECAKSGQQWIKTITTMDSKSATFQKDMAALSDSLGKVLKIEDELTKGTLRMGEAFQKWATENPDQLTKAMAGDIEAGAEAMEKIIQDSYEGMAVTEKGKQAWSDYQTTLGGLSDVWSGLDDAGIAEAGTDLTAIAQDATHAGNAAALAATQFAQGWVDAGSAMNLSAAQIQAGIQGMGFHLEPVEAEAAFDGQSLAQGVIAIPNEVGADVAPGNSESYGSSGSASATYWRVVSDGGPGGGGGGKGGGGGGGGGPKKVANKRKSQTVKRYKKNDARRSSAQSAKKSAEKSQDYLYGQSKIAQMEKINKLAEKEAHITSDRIKESQKYLKEDRENLIKVMQKWGYDAEFDEDGFLVSYEEAWTKVHDKIAALYADNELTADEQKLEEDYKVELEELEGALEDYENSLKELQADIEAYEESLYEMYDNKVEQMQHKVEFKIELNEDDLFYLDFWIEALGDSLYNALESLQTMGQKTNVLFSALDTYKQGVEDIYALSDDPLHTWATGGLDEVLTQDQVDALRENRDGLMEYMQQLLDLRETMQDKVLEVFDKWQEKLNSTMSTIEHYGSVLEHFKNIIDIVGKESLGLNDQFMSNLEQNAVNQSMDTIDATKSHYDAIVASNAEAQKNLEEAIASGDQSRIEHWEEVVKSTTEAMQEAQDSLLSSLENTLTMITEQFESAMTRAVEAFNDAIYAHGGLQGLQEDYSLIREQSELMAEDYQKIYELSKLNRNINKTLNDSNIIAGKQKMKSLQQEINELQASGVQLSQYDLEYLQAKYELRLAEIELENAQNNKDTVRLSKDSEGNWSYVYTSSVDKVDEAQQKYEDALYNMQNLSYEYMEEMSSTMMQTSLAMMEEIQALRIQDFDSYEAYSAEVQRIQDKYSAYLANQQDELNKSVANNEALYNQDWQSYSATTGYKISANQEWADSYSETTLGALMGSESEMSNFADTIFGLTGILTGELGASAQNYFTNMETAMNKYGTSISGFGTSTAASITNISTKSKSAASDMKTMAQDMTKSFREISETVSNWQREFSQKISDMLTEIGTLIQSINTAIEKSANLSGDNRNSNSLIGTKEAIELLNKSGKWGEWSKNENGTVNIKGFNRDLDGNGTIDKNVDEAAIVSINAALISEIDEMMKLYFNTNSESESRKTLGEQLKQMFKDYHEFRDIVSRIYDITDLKNPTYAEPTSMDTGGYTGEWGSSGKLAMLHEKELVLNQNDTANFLDALNISRDVLHSMIEMSAKQSSLALGNLIPSSIQDMSQNLEQQVSIVAEFPNAVERNEIEEAFNNLINTASQYANRHKV